MSRNTLYTAVAFALLIGYWWLYVRQDTVPAPGGGTAPPMSATAPAAPAATPREVSRAVDPFDSIVMQCRMELEVTTGGSSPLVLDAASDKLDLVRTEVANSTLTVSCGRGANGAIDGTMHVRVPMLKAIRAFNAGKITVIGLSADPFQVVRSIAGFTIDFSDDGDFVMENGAGTVELTTSRPLKASVSGAGHVIVHMSDAENLDAIVQGAGDVTATGHVKLLTANASGGRLHLRELAADDAQVVIDGSGTAEVNVSHSLDASVRGSGHVIYDGTPASVTPHVQGSGDVKSRDEVSLQDAPTVKRDPLYPVWNNMIGLPVQS